MRKLTQTSLQKAYQEIPPMPARRTHGHACFSRSGADLRLIGSLIIGLAGVDWLWTKHAELAFIGWTPVTLCLAFLGTIGALYGYSGRSTRLSDAGIYAALWVAFSVVGAIFTYVAATLRMPLHDAQLTRLDAALGFDWIQWVRFIGAYPLLQRVLALAYVTMLPQIIGSIIYFAHTRRSDRNREFLSTAMVSLILTTAVAAILPAVSPYVLLYGVQPEDSQVMLSLRNRTMSTITLGEMQGIIEFPSFHTVIAILLMYVHRPPSPSALPITILNFLMLLSLPSCGHHYLADIVAGAGVAALAIAITRLIIRKPSCVK
jgi:hypothetical protein